VLEDAYGVRFILYPWDRPNLLALLERRQDNAQFQAMSLLIRPGAVVFDVGAHIGVYSVLSSRLCAPGGSVYAFEPAPETHRRLCETLALNHCANVLPVQEAISDRIGRATIYLFEPRCSEWNSMGQPLMTTPEGQHVAHQSSIKVSSVTLDHFCATRKIERIHFLKVDVEGFENAVFSGAGQLLRHRRIDSICFEISQAPLQAAGETARKVFESLAAHGYLAYGFDPRSGMFYGPIHDSSDYWTNYFASWRDLSAARCGTAESERRASGEQADRGVPRQTGVAGEP
jgi:FkbM family methyltransferase